MVQQSIYERYIKGRAKERGYSVTGLAASLGLSVPTLYKKMRGQAQWCESELRMMALVLDLTDEELLALGVLRMIPHRGDV